MYLHFICHTRCNTILYKLSLVISKYEFYNKVCDFVKFMLHHYLVEDILDNFLFWDVDTHRSVQDVQLMFKLPQNRTHNMIYIYILEVFHIIKIIDHHQHRDMENVFFSHFLPQGMRRRQQKKNQIKALYHIQHSSLGDQFISYSF